VNLWECHAIYTLNFFKVTERTAKMENELLRDTIIISAFIIGAAITSFIFFKILRKIFHRNKGFDPVLLKKANFPALVLLIILSITLALPLTDLEKYITPSVNHILSILLIFFIAWLLIESIAIGRAVVLSRFKIEAQDNLRARKVYTQLRILERILVFLIILISIGIVLMTFETIRQIGVSLLASAGLAGIIIGFAAQKAIATMLAGFQIAVTQPIRIDDVVIVDGEWGRIEEINLTYVVVKIWDERRLIVPTTFFIENNFQNWTRTSADIIGSIFIYADYSVDFEALRQQFMNIIQDEGKWDKRVAVMQVTDSTEKTVQIRFLISARDAGIAWDLRVSIREKLIKYLQEKHPDALPRHRLENIDDNSPNTLRHSHQS
jgi:small-conductance mechanosensitive channel